MPVKITTKESTRFEQPATVAVLFGGLFLTRKHIVEAVIGPLTTAIIRNDVARYKALLLSKLKTVNKMIAAT